MAIEVKNQKQRDDFMWDDDRKFGETFTVPVVDHPELGRFSLAEFIDSYEQDNRLGISEEDYQAAKKAFDQETDRHCRQPTTKYPPQTAPYSKKVSVTTDFFLFAFCYRIVTKLSVRCQVLLATPLY